MKMVQIKVYLNGTDRNPWDQWHLTQNPFPQLGRAEYDAHLLHLAKLDGDPIPDTDYIRQHLQGWDQQFVDYVCKRFQKGKRVAFVVEWPEESPWR